MWILRYVMFSLQESSKYLVAKGRDEEAIKVCHEKGFLKNFFEFFLEGPGAYCSCKWEKNHSYSRETASNLGWSKRVDYTIDYSANHQKIVLIFLTVGVNCFSIVHTTEVLFKVSCPASILYSSIGYQY